jgi:hypothetical protein
VPRPFVAYLRVYEPLSAFDTPLAKRLHEAAKTGRIARSSAGDHERHVWLKSHLAKLPLPRDNPRDVLVIDPKEVPVEAATVGPGPLVCPLDMRARSAAALVGFLATSQPALRTAVLDESPETARQRATGVLAEMTSGAVHVVSTTWTVPLPWFCLVDPAQRKVVVAEQHDPKRQVYWQAAMADARRRVSRAHGLAKRTFGEAGPTKVLADTGRWLEHFHPHSAVELDYGGLVQLLDDDDLVRDTSAEDVNEILDALENGDMDQVAARFERLRDFWGDLAIRERFN